MATPCTMPARSSSVSTREAASLASSLPRLPMATPMCAAFSAGPSFTPSPVMATTWPSAFKALMMRSLASGNMRVKMSVRRTASLNAGSSKRSSSSPSMVRRSPWKPICLAMAAVVTALSPVMIFTWMPASSNWLKTSRMLGFGGSMKATKPRYSIRNSSWLSG